MATATVDVLASESHGWQTTTANSSSSFGSTNLVPEGGLGPEYFCLTGNEDEQQQQPLARRRLSSQSLTKSPRTNKDCIVGVNKVYVGGVARRINNLPTPEWEDLDVDFDDEIFAKTANRRYSEIGPKAARVPTPATHAWRGAGGMSSDTNKDNMMDHSDVPCAVELDPFTGGVLEVAKFSETMNDSSAAEAARRRIYNHSFRYQPQYASIDDTNDDGTFDDYEDCDDHEEDESWPQYNKFASKASSFLSSFPLWTNKTGVKRALMIDDNAIERAVAPPGHTPCTSAKRVKLVEWKDDGLDIAHNWEVKYNETPPPVDVPVVSMPVQTCRVSVEEAIDSAIASTGMHDTADLCSSGSAGATVVGRAEENMLASVNMTLSDSSCGDASETLNAEGNAESVADDDDKTSVHLLGSDENNESGQLLNCDIAMKSCGGFRNSLDVESYRRKQRRLLRKVRKESRRRRCLIVFDWDDTILPTSWLREEGHLGAAHTKRPFESLPVAMREKLSAIVVTAKATLYRAAGLGKVVVITNAIHTWIPQTCKAYLPGMAGLLEELNIKCISAKFMYGLSDPTHSSHPQDWKIRAFEDEARKFIEATATVDNDMACVPLDTKTACVSKVEEGNVAKDGDASSFCSALSDCSTSSSLTSSEANKRCLSPAACTEITEENFEQFVAAMEGQMQRRVVSIGDSVFERIATLRLKKTFPGIAVKSLQFIFRADADLLELQHAHLQRRLSKLVRSNHPLTDLHFEQDDDI